MEMGSMPASPHIHKNATLIHGPLIIGAGPSGLAVAACLSNLHIPSLILEKSNCLASLWQNKTYNRLKLHLPKQFCELPMMPFPSHFPKYPSKEQFISYLESYALKFGIEPKFCCAVKSTEFEEKIGFWKVVTENGNEYLSKWVVVATGENADAFVPEIHGMEKFCKRAVHTCGYKSGKIFKGEKVLVVGCGNSGMEVSLDLCRHGAKPYLVVRNSVHVLPREMLGISTFGVAMALLKWLPLKFVDKFLLTMANLILGDTDKLGLKRPKVGPIELKNLTGKTPVLDVGTLAQIKSGNITVMVGVKEMTREGAKFVDGKEENFDSVIFATGYKSNVPAWLKGGDDLFTKEGIPKEEFPNGWKGENGLYCVGFTRRGLLGTSCDALNIARDISMKWCSET